MKVYLTDQKVNFKKHLELLKANPVKPYRKEALKARTSTIKLETTKSIDQLNLDFLFNYQIFPCSIMVSLNQWNDEHREMALGDTIVQQAYIPPTKIFSQKIIFGVRISEIINQPERKGFSYETLEGHVEKGVSTFTVERLGSQLVFKIQTYSSPGLFLSKLVGHIFSVPYQAFCSRAALKSAKEQLEAH